MLDKLTGQKMVCPWWLCFTFDNPIRKLLHHPETLLSPYVRPGNTVIDIGAGMGYFSIPLCKADVIIKPKVAYIGSADFSKRHEAILEGEKAAIEALPQIMQIITQLRLEGRLE